MRSASIVSRYTIWPLSITVAWLAIVECWPQLSTDLPPEVKHADLVMLATEKRDLLGPEPKAWIPMPAPLDERIEIWPADVAEDAFLDRFAELGGHRAHERAAAI